MFTMAYRTEILYHIFVPGTLQHNVLFLSTAKHTFLYPFSAYPTVCYKKNVVLQYITVFPSFVFVYTL
jgi:hypothetical protein